MLEIASYHSDKELAKMSSNAKSLPWQTVILFASITIPVSSAWRVNITSFGNCADEHWNPSKHAVIIKDIKYEMVDGFCDTINGIYEIPTVNTADKLFKITMFRCPTGSTGQCNDNAELFVEHMHCERFKNDVTGPWFMISDAMTGSHCGEEKGEFKLENARLKPEYLSKFMIEDVEHARHRMQLLIVKKGITEAEDLERACMNFEFDLIF